VGQKWAQMLRTDELCNRFASVFKKLNLQVELTKFCKQTLRTFNSIDFLTSHELEAMSFKLQVASFKLQATSYELQVMSYEIQDMS
jgi:hypothetical protein